MPEGFEEVYICDVLGITYTELQKQPHEWVQNMILWHEQKSKAEDAKSKLKTPKKK